MHKTRGGNDMNIYFERLGFINKGELNLNGFTLLCGPNNTGKTYAMYSLYGLLNNNFEVHFEFLADVLRQLAAKNVYQVDLRDLMAQHFDSMIRQIEDSFHKQLPRLFSVEESDFLNTKIKLTFDRDALLQRATDNEWKTKLSFGKEKDWFLYIEKAANQTMLTLSLRETNWPQDILIAFISSHIVKLIFSNISRRCFLLPAERSGLNLFFKELSSIRNRLLHQAQKYHINPIEFLQDLIESRYAEPISDYIEFLNSLDAVKKHKGQFCATAQEIQNEILKGQYEVSQHGDVYFLPDHGEQKKMPLHFTSSTVKTFFGLVFYLNHLAQKGDCLMIDEPELNLHPENQRTIVRILVALVNAGLKIIVSTHSDYFVRELNNLILFNRDFRQSAELKKKYGYAQTDALDSRHISAYLFEHHKITPLEFIPDEGFIAETFDNVIRSLNQSSHDIYYTIQEELEEPESDV
jgi:predicted ATPase